MNLYYSDLNVFKSEQLTLLKNGNSIFLEISINQIGDEEVEITNLEEQYKMISEYSNLSQSDKYIICNNIITLVQNKEKYLDFDINFTNIYMNNNLELKVFIRKISIDEVDYVKNVKAFIYALLKDLDYELVYNSEYDKYKTVSEIYELHTLEEIKKQLIVESTMYREKQENEYTKVKRKKFKKINSRNIFKNITISILFILLIFNFIYFYKFEQTKALAYESYINKDYNGVVTQLNKYINRLSTSENVMLSKSIIETQNLTDDQKLLLLSGLDETVSEDVFKYWSAIANQDYEEAISLAQVLNNIDFEIYASVCYLEFLEVETNGKFNSEERASKISEITSQLETLNETKTQVNEVAL